jgi:hypothetical protein
MMWELYGAVAFGFVLGWNLYFVNRYRTDQITLSHLTSVVGVLGGAGVLALFPAETQLFGAYGLGLALGFVTYLALLLVMVAKSKQFGVEWFLDGRRARLGPDEYVPEGTRTTGAPMDRPDKRLPR